MVALIPLLFALLASGTAHSAFDLPPPPTRAEALKLDYWGTQLLDPYAWLERADSPAVKAWYKTQNDYTRGVLDAMPGRSALRNRLAELYDAGVQVSDLELEADTAFFFRRDAGASQYRLYSRDAKGNERLLVEPTRFDAAGQPAAIDYFRASPNGKLLAFGISLGGSENSVLHVIDTATGEPRGTPIDRAEGAAPCWRMDSQALYYTRLAAPKPGDPPAARYKDSLAWMREFRAELPGGLRDSPLLGRGLQRGIELAEDDSPAIVTSPVSPWAVGVISHGVQNELTLYVAPVPALRASNTPWRKVIDVEDGVTSFDLRGDYLYLRTHDHAPRFRIVRIALSNSAPQAMQRAEEVVPASDRVITALAVAKDALYVRELDAGYGRLLRLQYNVKPPKASRTAKKKPRALKVASRGKQKPAAPKKIAGITLRQEVALPFPGAIRELVADPLQKGAMIKLTSWTEPARYLKINGKTGRIEASDLLPLPHVDTREMTASQVKVTSHDGTQVPLSLVHRKDLRLDGNAPTLLLAYGAYGMISEPRFNPMELAWLERGGVLAIAHVRGGGEFGIEWHMGGYQKTKPNTWKDAIAAAEYLIARGYTRPARLAAMGTSAGGVMVGGLLVERPELFAALISNVGVHDSVAAEISANGPPNVPEFGSNTTEEGFRSLLAMSSYYRVEDGKPYPAMLLNTGLNDPRVDSWQPGKMAARLQAINFGPGGSRQPVLLRVDDAAGHGLTATRDQSIDALADRLAFLFWRMGVEEFQPAAK